MASEVVAHLPSDARRIVVRGTSGSGKTTLARTIAAARDLAHIELDAVFHQAGWTPLDDARFRDRVGAVARSEAWVACGNYRTVADLLMDRCDTVVLYDLPRRLVMARIVRRTLRRIVRREELWNGNRERVRNLFTTDPESSVIAWAWTTHARRHEETTRFVDAPPRDGLRIVHIRSNEDERRVLASLAEAAPEGAGRSG